MKPDAVFGLGNLAARRACGYDRRLGLGLCNGYGRHFLNTVARTAETIESVGSEQVFIRLDTRRMNMDEAGMAEGFADAGMHLGHVHLSESNSGVHGRGTINLARASQALKAICHGGVPKLASFSNASPDVASGVAVRWPVAERPEYVIKVGMPFRREQAIANSRPFSS